MSRTISPVSQMSSYGVTGTPWANKTILLHCKIWNKRLKTKNIKWTKNSCIVKKTNRFYTMTLLCERFDLTRCSYWTALSLCQQMKDLVFWLAFNTKFMPPSLNSSPPEQNGCHFAENAFRCIFVNEKFCILIKISLMFVPKCLIDNKPGLAKIMAWHQIGTKPLSEAMLTQFTDAYMWH